MGENNPVLSAEELERFYGDFYRKRPKARLHSNAIPRQFWPLVPYAEFWGIADDWGRESLVDEAPLSIQQNLKVVVALFDNALDEWLAGPEADHPPFSKEYIAFSAMRRAADYV